MGRSGFGADSTPLAGVSKHVSRKEEKLIFVQL
jgi:hypothetical protein